MPSNLGVVASGVSVEWTPASLPALALWLDASDTATITASGGKVSQWADKSGAARHMTQTVATNQPTTGGTRNGLNIIQSPDFDFLINNNAQLARNVTGVTIMGTCAMTTNDTLITIDTNQTDFARAAVGSSVGSVRRAGGRRLNSDTFAAVTVASDTAWNLIGGVFDYGSASLALDINGTLTNFSGAWQTPGATPSDGGRTRVALSQALSPTSVGEIVVCHTILSTVERQTLEAYLRTKWATP